MNRSSRLSTLPATLPVWGEAAHLLLRPRLRWLSRRVISPFRPNVISPSLRREENGAYTEDASLQPSGEEHRTVEALLMRARAVQVQGR